MTRVQVDVTHFFDPAEIEALARETGFVERSSPITGMKVLVTFSAGLLNTPDGTLGQLAGFLGATCGTPVSPQALDERIGPGARRFLHACMAKALTMSSHVTRLGEDALRGFDHVYVIDSTNFDLDPALAPTFKGNGGGASKAATGGRRGSNLRDRQFSACRAWHDTKILVPADPARVAGRSNCGSAQLVGFLA